MNPANTSNHSNSPAMAGPLENIVMRKCKINYAKSRKLCIQARENLGVSKWSIGWTAALEAECLSLHNEQIDDPPIKQKQIYTSNASVDTKTTKDLTCSTAEMTTAEISTTSGEWATCSKKFEAREPAKLPLAAGSPKISKGTVAPILRKKRPKSSFQQTFKYSQWSRSEDTWKDQSISDISDITADSMGQDSFSILDASLLSIEAISETRTCFDSMGSSAWTLWSEDSKEDVSLVSESDPNSSASDCDVSEWEINSSETVLAPHHARYLATEGQKDRCAPRLPKRVPSAEEDRIFSFDAGSTIDQLLSGELMART